MSLVLLSIHLALGADEASGSAVRGIVSGTPSGSPVPWHVVLVVGLAALVAWATRPSQDSGVLHRVWPALVLGSALPRLLLPGAFVHVDGDDLALAATIRGMDTVGQGDNGTQFMATALSLHQAFRRLFGDTYDVIFLPARAAATLMPALGARLTWRWSGSAAQALAVALLLLTSPVYLSGGVSTHLEMPAAALLVGAAVMVLEGERRGPWIRLLSVVGAVCAAVLASGLKEEMPIWAGMWAIAMVGAPGSRRSQATRLVPVVATAVLLYALAPDSGPMASGLAERRSSHLSVEHTLLYVGMGLMLLGPPWPPLSWSFARGLIRPPRRDLRPAQLAVLGMVGMYASASRIIGPNHLRYALGWMPLLALCVAPDVVRWWQGRSTRRHRLALAALAASWWMGAAWWALQLNGPQQRDLSALGHAPPPDGALVLFARHGQDRSVGSTMGVVGATASIGLDVLWPASCAPALAIERVHVRTAFKDLTFKLGSHARRFEDAAALDDDLAWWQAQDLPDDLHVLGDGFIERLDQAKARLDDGACRAAVAGLHDLLTPYPRLLLYVDALSSPSALDSAFTALAPFTDDRPGEVIDVALAALSTTPRPPGPGWVEVLAVPDPMDPSGPPVWTSQGTASK